MKCPVLTKILHHAPWVWLPQPRDIQRKKIGQEKSLSEIGVLCGGAVMLSFVMLLFPISSAVYGVFFRSSVVNGISHLTVFFVVFCHSQANYAFYSYLSRAT